MNTLIFRFISYCPSEKFMEHIVTYQDFVSNPGIIEDPSLVICINSKWVVKIATCQNTFVLQMLNNYLCVTDTITGLWLLRWSCPWPLSRRTYQKYFIFYISDFFFASFSVRIKMALFCCMFHRIPLISLLKTKCLKSLDVGGSPGEGETSASARYAHKCLFNSDSDFSSLDR